MDEDSKKDVGLFKYSIIGGIVANTNPGMTKEQLYRDLSQNTYVHPGGKSVKYAASTIKGWYLKFDKDGLPALRSKQRSDLGRSRCLTEEHQNRIRELLTQFPKISAVKVREKMIEEGSIMATEASEDTFQRYIRTIRDTDEVTEQECLAFEFEHVNDCWQGDTMEAPIGGVQKPKKSKSGQKDGEKNAKNTLYCISFIDDRSRKFVNSEIFFEDSSITAVISLKHAVEKCGVPKRLVLDNGTPYKNAQFEEICAELGIGKIHLRPYCPQGKGKVERNQRTIQEKVFNCNSFDQFKDLKSLNEFYQGQVRKEHDQQINRTTGETPDQRFMKEYDRIRRIPKERLDIIFMFRDSRWLNKDSTILFQNVRYEVPQEYINTLPKKRSKIRFRYDPTDTSVLYIVDENEYVIRYKLKPVDLAANSKRKRTKGAPIDYTVT